jgi:hypothetical protein
MSHVDDVAAAWRALLLSPEPVYLEGPQAPHRRQRVYRALVRSTLGGAVRRACPHARRLAGDDVFDRFVDRFLAEQPPTTRQLHWVAGQFAAWLSTLPGSDLPHPSFAELCHFEALEIDVTMSSTCREIPPTQRAVSDLAEDLIVVADPSTRLAVYRHPVHRVTPTTPSWPAPSEAPSFILCFQRAEAFVVEAVSAAVARVVVMSGEGVAIGAALDVLGAEAEAADVVFDRARVRADLVDLQRRGALVGFSS